MNSQTIDLIATDPPFNKGRDFHSTPDKLGEDTGFQDRWRWIEDVQPEWVAAIEADWEGVSWAIESARVTYGEDMAAFLCFLGVRLIEMHRVLKPTGSIYLHCDDTAGAYIKALMDSIFGRDQFRNTITWKRTSGRSDAQRFARVSDRILYYVKGGGEPTWNGAWMPLSDDYIKKFYRYEDARGRYLADNLNGPAHGADGSAPSAQPWRGVDPLAVGRVWSVPRTGAYAEWIEREVIPGYRYIESIAGRLDALDAAGLIHWPKRDDGMPRIKRYLEASRGVAASDIITDIGVLAAHATERTGYPTQKPIALYRRLIEASSNPGDMVLDPFAGCATTPIAAELAGRRWVAMDLWDEAHEVVTERLQQEVRMANPDARIDYSVRLVTEPPVRDADGEDAAPFLPTPKGKAKRQRPAWQRMTKADMVRTLAEAQQGRAGVVCAGCGVELAARYFELDHREPKGIGGEDWITNRVLLCGPCNGRKSHRLTLAGLRADNSKPDAGGETWMVNALAADAADARAREVARAIRDGG